MSLCLEYYLRIIFSQYIRYHFTVFWFPLFLLRSQLSFCHLFEHTILFLSFLLIFFLYCSFLKNHYNVLRYGFLFCIPLWLLNSQILKLVSFNRTGKFLAIICISLSFQNSNLLKYMLEVLTIFTHPFFNIFHLFTSPAAFWMLSSNLSSSSLIFSSAVSNLTLN